MKKQIVGYIRVSTSEQEESGLGLEAQKAKIESFCACYELELTTIYSEAASAKDLNRPELQKALADVKSGKASGLIIAKLDRLTRSVTNLGFLLETVFSKYDLFVVAEQVDTRTATGRMILNLMMSVSQWERETIGERTADAMQAKRTRGEFCGGKVPYGFAIASDGKTLLENEEEQRTIEHMKSLRAAGYSFRAIAHELKANGIFSRNGETFCHTSVASILKYRKAA